MSGQIFICYRRDDTAYVTGYINDRLSQEFGPDSVFTDVDNIALGVDFRAILDETVGQCQIFLAVIGDNWLTARNADGELRLQDQSDFVRIEIESALQRNIPVIPLLVGGTKMPSADELPESLRDLAYRNGTPIRPAPDFHGDIDRLVNSLKHHLQPRPKQAKTGARKPASAPAVQKPASKNLAAAARKAKGQTAVPQAQRSAIRPAEDERARHLAQMGKGRDDKRSRPFFLRPTFVIALLVLAGASWYIDFEYRKTFDEALAVIQGLVSAPPTEEPAVDAGIAVTEEGPGNTPVEPLEVADPVTGMPQEFALSPEAQEAFVDEYEAPIEVPEVVVPQDESVSTGAEDVVDAPVEQEVLVEPPPTADSAEEKPEMAAQLDESVSVAVAETSAQLPPARSPQEIISEGVSLAARGDHEAAIAQYDEAIQSGMESGFAYRQRGASYHALANYEAAIADFSAAVDLNPDDVNAYIARANSHRWSGDHAAAISDYDEAIRVNDTDADIYELRAAAHDALGNEEAAASDRATSADLRSAPPEEAPVTEAPDQ